MRRRLMQIAVVALLLSANCYAQDADNAAGENKIVQPADATPEEFSAPQEPAISEPPDVPGPPVSEPAPTAPPLPGGAVSIGPGDNAASAVTQGTDKSTISLDVKGMDVVDVLKMLAQRSGLNLVIGKNVAGRVTLLLKNVNVRDAFDILILANDLAYDNKGDILNIMTQRDYELIYGARFQDMKKARIIKLKYAKAAEMAKSLNQIKSNVGRIVVDEGSNTLAVMDSPEKLADMDHFILAADIETKTAIFGLNYAKAEQLNAKLQDVITKGVGSLKVDERTNKIVVTDYPSKLEEIGRIIAEFDEKTPQVIIDAQIIEVRPSDKLEMGVNWDYWIEKHFQMTSAMPIGAEGRLVIGTPPSDAVTGPGDYKGIVDLLRTIGDAKVLSTPRIMALNNQEAKILVGTKDAYVTSSVSQSGDSAITSQSVNFVDVGIKLYVTPTINRDGMVSMKIRPEISSAERQRILSNGQLTEIPIVTTAEAETSVMIKDGVTIIIGGLRKDSRTKTVKKIPVAGDIPLLGFFFRSTVDEVQKTDLVILLTPHIISGNDAITEPVTPKDGAVVSMVNGKIVQEKYSPGI